jgi:hypothetical protein
MGEARGWTPFTCANAHRFAVEKIPADRDLKCPDCGTITIATLLDVVVPDREAVSAERVQAVAAGGLLAALVPDADSYWHEQIVRAVLERDAELKNL